MRRWATPFVIYGTNPILAYGLSSLVIKLLALIHVPGAAGQPVALQLFLFERLFAAGRQPSAGVAALRADLHAAVVRRDASVLYRRGVFVKI